MIGVLSRRAFPYSVVNNALNELLNIRNEKHEN
jgi:hypothetical protein